MPLWPLFFWRIQRLKAWFRANGGPGSEMLWGGMWNGRVVVVRLSDDLSGHFPGSGFGSAKSRSVRNPIPVSPANAGAAKGFAIAMRMPRSRRKRRAGEPATPPHLTLTHTKPHPDPTPSAPTGAACAAQVRYLFILQARLALLTMPRQLDGQ